MPLVRETLRRHRGRDELQTEAVKRLGGALPGVPAAAQGLFGRHASTYRGRAERLCGRPFPGQTGVLKSAYALTVAGRLMRASGSTVVSPGRSSYAIRFRRGKAGRTMSSSCGRAADVVN